MVLELAVLVVVVAAVAYFVGTKSGKAEAVKAIAAAKVEFAKIEAEAVTVEKSVVAKIKTIFPKL